MKKQFGLLAAVLVFAAQSFASGAIIRSDRASETRVIAITEHGSQLGFRLCDTQTRKCQRIGNRDLYPRAEFAKKVRSEYTKSLASGVADAAGGYAIFVGGALLTVGGIDLVAGGGGASEVTAVFGALAGGAVIATASEYAISFIDVMNPINHAQKALLVRRSLREGTSITHDIMKQRDMLAGVLATLEK